jgi:hypothetical protein
MTDMLPAPSPALEFFIACIFYTLQIFAIMTTMKQAISLTQHLPAQEIARFMDFNLTVS